MAQAVRVVVAALLLAVVLMVGTTVVGDITGDEEGLRTSEDVVVELGEADSWTRISDASGYSETVRNSRGYAINLTGADDSYVQSQDKYEVAADDTWTISAWGRVDQGAGNENMTLVSANGRVVISYNGSQGNWSAWYYDEGSTDSWQVNASAPNQPGNLTNVIVWSNSTHLTIYRNNTQGDVKNITGSNIADAPVMSQNWDGRIDEVRTFDDALDDANRSTIVNSPVDPVPDTNRTSRIMFDEPNKSTQSIFFTGTRLEQSNVTFSDGLDGSVMTGESLISNIMGTTDYVWETSGPQIYPVSGGDLDGAPAAYVEYERESALFDVVGGWVDLVGVAALIPLIAIALLIVSRMRRAG